jgi:hypothetical protein
VLLGMPGRSGSASSPRASRTPSTGGGGHGTMSLFRVARSLYLFLLWQTGCHSFISSWLIGQLPALRELQKHGGGQRPRSMRPRRLSCFSLVTSPEVKRVARYSWPLGQSPALRELQKHGGGQRPRSMRPRRLSYLSLVTSPEVKRVARYSWPLGQSPALRELQKRGGWDSIPVSCGPVADFRRGELCRMCHGTGKGQLQAHFRGERGGCAY